MTTVDLRSNILSPAIPDQGFGRSFIMSCKVDVPALIAAGTLGATGLYIGYYYNLFSLPKYTIVKGAWAFVRTVESVAPTATITIENQTPAVFGLAISLATAGLALVASGGGWTIAQIIGHNTGAGTDIINILINTASVTTAIFDVCVDCINGQFPYNAGSTGTGQ